MAVDTRVEEIPQVDLGGLKVSRLIVGGNPLSGISHQTEEKDMEMRRYFTTQGIHDLWRECERNGINTCIARADNHIMRNLLEYHDKGGEIQWIAQTAMERASIEDNVQAAKYFGAKACFIHGGTVGKLWKEGAIERIREVLRFIREQGLPAGMASHDPEVILTADQEGFEADFFLTCMYNISGRMGKILESKDELFVDEDRPKVLSVIPRLSKPTIAYKVLAAGRKDPEEAYREVFGALKNTDGVLVGMYPAANPAMVRENAEIIRRILREKSEAS
jgi:hypothetical protein